MPRLSIVIASPVFNPHVEDTLVSVLQNRPEYSEVIVMTSESYEDPYGLGREVRFLTTNSAANPIDLINQGCRHASGDVIHLLMPGTVVTDGWTDRIWQHFADNEVGAVAAVMVESLESTRLLGAGVDYLSRGERRVAGAGLGVADSRLTSLTVLGPLLTGGFYRRDAILALGGFDATFGDSLADVEIGLAFQELGLRTVVEPTSRLIATSPVITSPRDYREASQAERLFRQRTASGTSVWGHRTMVLFELLKGFPRPRMIGRLLGRMAGKREDVRRAAYESRLQLAREELAKRAEEVATIPIGTKALAARVRRRMAA